MKSILISLYIVFTIFLYGLTTVHAESVIIVRVVNEHPFPVQVNSQTFNRFGHPQWVFVATVPPRSYIDIPNVPIGAMLGVESSQLRRAWQSFKVSKTNKSYFEYKVMP